MAARDADLLRNKLIIYRLLLLVLIAFLLIQFNIVNNTNGTRDIGLYIFALIISLPITMLLDKYLVKLAKKH
jgi:hypothetical protein